MRIATCLAFLLILPSVADAGELRVEDAYKAIPHRRTAFDIPASKLSASESTAIKQLFDLTDRGVVLRVEGMQALQARDDVRLQRVSSDYSDLAARLESLVAMEKINDAKALILQSIRLHQRYFDIERRRQSEGKAGSTYVGNREVVSASEHLRMAYSLLLKNFPRESDLNRQAFYDHLCALDFL